VSCSPPSEDFDAALDEINDTPFGLQAGVFTRDLYKAQRAWDRLEVGAVLIGEVPSWRVDHMPTEASGLRPRTRGTPLRDRGHDGDPIARDPDSLTRARRFASATTWSSIAGVSRPVKVFCWLTW